MRFYKVETDMEISGGSASLVTLNMIGGLCHQTYVKAQTSSTAFKMNIVDDKSRTIRTYGIHRGEINDYSIYPLQGEYTINIQNVSAGDNFNILLAIEE